MSKKINITNKQKGKSSKKEKKVNFIGLRNGSFTLHGNDTGKGTGYETGSNRG